MFQKSHFFDKYAHKICAIFEHVELWCSGGLKVKFTPNIRVLHHPMAHCDVSAREKKFLTFFEKTFFRWKLKISMFRKICHVLAHFTTMIMHLCRKKYFERHSSMLQVSKVIRQISCSWIVFILAQKYFFRTQTTIYKKWVQMYCGRRFKRKLWDLAIFSTLVALFSAE